MTENIRTPYPKSFLLILRKSHAGCGRKGGFDPKTPAVASLLVIVSAELTTRHIMRPMTHLTHQRTDPDP